MALDYDFSGYATKVGLKCSDGRVILKDAFKHMDKQQVQLVWQHLHTNPENVLGHAILENRDDGVYAYCKFNETDAAKTAKELVRHKDITALSIYANQLKEQAKQVIHGMIREVSLVLSGANPGAFIDNIQFAHGDDFTVDETEAIIYTGLSFIHSEGDTNMNDILNVAAPSYQESATIQEIFNTLNDTQKEAVDIMLQHAATMNTSYEDDVIQHAAAKKYADDATVQDVFDTLDETQKTAVYAMIAGIIEEYGGEDEAKHFNQEGDNIMKSNVFDNGTQTQIPSGPVLTHDQLSDIMKDAVASKTTSLKETFLAHAAAYGIENIEVLFPDARLLRNTPDMVRRETEWVSSFLSGVNKTPFSRIRSHSADITADEARAKGYITGNRKKEEVLPVLKRITTPTTIYKKQKLDRDDIVDITDFDVVAWLKAEMRTMLNEEIARAGLIGDGRTLDDADSVNPEHIRPVWTDDELYSHKMVLPKNTTILDFIDEVVRARKHYKGTGTPNFYTTEETITDMLLARDLNQRRVYPTMAELTSALRVSNLIAVEVMENQTREVGNETRKLRGIMLNPRDYTIGADKGGEVNLFDDFDIDYNQHKYLIETRISGALTKPKSAVVLEEMTEDTNG